jgi:hypothetical protein
MAVAGAVIGIGEVQSLERAPQKPAAVVGVEDVEAGAQPGDLGFLAQLPRREAVERAEPGRCAATVEGGADAVAHFGRRLVREGDGENTVRGDAALGDPPADGGCQGPGLAGPGPGQHQHGARLRRCRSLLRCEVGEASRGGCHFPISPPICRTSFQSVPTGAAAVRRGRRRPRRVRRGEPHSVRRPGSRRWRRRRMRRGVARCGREVARWRARSSVPCRRRSRRIMCRHGCSRSPRG